jgi:signal transduction histidine kinase
VYFDPHHLEIVLSNLCSNAIKFTPDKGRIWVHIARKNNETVEITVGDNGIGIPKESEDKIFSNYYQANAGGIKNLGSGIGLAFSKSLVELHKGKLNFQSDINPETGRQETRFIVTLQLGKDHFTGNRLIQINCF